MNFYSGFQRGFTRMDIVVGTVTKEKAHPIGLGINPTSAGAARGLTLPLQGQPAPHPEHHDHVLVRVESRIDEQLDVRGDGERPEWTPSV